MDCCDAASHSCSRAVRRAWLRECCACAADVPCAVLLFCAVEGCELRAVVGKTEVVLAAHRGAEAVEDGSTEELSST